MLVNGRPYSNENGHIDNALITDRDEMEINKVMEWIRANIRKSNRILQGRTSYGLKHVLEHDTGLYLTNNEFKDAMLLAGFKPVNPSELNWRYRIVLTSSINHNPSPFFQWAKQYENEPNPCGDFVGDMLRDFTFPVFAERGVILRYLFRSGACSGAVDAFKELWRAYEREAS